MYTSNPNPTKWITKGLIFKKFFLQLGDHVPVALSIEETRYDKNYRPKLKVRLREEVNVKELSDMKVT